MFESWVQKMGAGILFLVLSPEKIPFTLWLWFVISPAFAWVCVQNLDFHLKSPFSLLIGRDGCCTRSKTSPLLQPRECNAPKTCHHSQFENALRSWRLFEVALVSSLMPLGHYGSKNTIISPARASGTIWAPISRRSLLSGRDSSSNKLFPPHILDIYWVPSVF